MNETGAFTLRAMQEDAWPLGATEIQALLEITATPDADPGGRLAPGAAEVVIMDCSGSMANPPAKLRAAKRAVHAALDTMRDGTDFAVLAGTASAKVVYPRAPALERASPQTREAAKRAVDRLDAADGTRISSWLNAARVLLEPYPGHVRHAMLFTDGKNEHESRDGTLDRVLASCRGTFMCDARGIGDGWDPSDLLKITGELHGNADGLPDVADLERDFRVVMRAAMGKVVPDVALRIRTSRVAELRQIRQTYPGVADLTGQGQSAGASATDYWIGSWGGEIRHYLLTLSVDPGAAVPGPEVRLASAEVAVRGPAGRVAGPVFIDARWMADAQPPTGGLTDIYGLQQQAGEAIAIGAHAWYRDDLPGAEAAWGKAARLASAAGDTERLAVLESLVVILDPAAGQVRLREDISRAIVLKAEARSATSTFVPTETPDQASRGTARDPSATVPPPGERPPRVSRACPDCQWISPSGAVFCERCSRQLVPAAAAQEGDG